VNENIIIFLRMNEAVSLRVVEPLHGPFGEFTLGVDPRTAQAIQNGGLGFLKSLRGKWRQLALAATSPGYSCPRMIGP